MSLDAAPGQARVEMRLNGAPVALEGDPARRLSEVLREDLGLRGTKVGCDAGDCGACTVLLDGVPVCACLTPAMQAAGREVTTVEGLGGEALNRLQRAFLRHGAAQCGICTPGMLMAATALLAATPRPTPAQAEEALAGVLCRCTGYAKIVAAVCDAWRDPAQAPPPEAGQAVGAPIERLDGAAKVAGTEVFGADAMPPGEALLVRAVRSPHHAADFGFGDLAAWRTAHPVVVAVFTAADIPGRNRFGVIAPFADQPALAEGRGRFRGEAVALVAGEPAAMAALELADFPVVWTEKPHNLTLPAGEDDIHPERPGNELIRGYVACADAEAALAGAAHVVEGAIDTAFVEHACIEPEAGAAWLEGDTLVIRACTQAPMMDRDDTAAILGLAPERVRMIPTAAGGGFGTKLDLSLQPLIGLVALKTGRPARMVYSRHDSMTSTTKRHPARMRARIGADADGRIVAMWFDGDFNTGAYASWGPTVANRVPVHACGPYRTPAYRAEARAIHTNGPPAGAFRGFGVPQAAVLQETLYDDLAIAAGLDRLAFRRLNALRDGDATPTGQVLRGVGIAECLEALAPHWERALSDAAAFNDAAGTRRRGAGVAACWYGCGNTALPNPSTIRVGLTAQGRLVLHQGACDIGQGANTVITQICADALGLPVADFHLVGPDTTLTPDAGKTSASRQTYVSGKAAELAGRALRAAILRRANMGDGARIALDGDALTITGGEATARLELGDLPEGAGGGDL